MKSNALGEVCTVVNGGTPDTKVAEFWGGTNAWITPAEMGNLSTPYLDASRRTITEEGLRNSSAQLLPKHSVILSSRAPIGHLVINEIPMASNQGCKGLIPNKDLSYKYLYYFLYCNKEYLNSLGSGTTFAEISGTKLKEVQIPLPSLGKQKEIVKKLDSVFAEIGNGLQNCKSQLDAATEILGQQIELILDSKQSGWVTKTLFEWCDQIGTGPFGSAVHKADYLDQGIALVNPSNIGDGFIIHDGIKRVGAKKAGELSSYKLREGDLVLGRRGEMGRCAVTSKEEEGWICGTGSFFLRPNRDCDSVLLSRVIRSQRIRSELQRISTGVTMSNLNNKVVGAIPISLPKRDVQAVVLRKIDELEGSLSIATAQIARKMELFLELRQSLLNNVLTEAA